MLSLALRIGSWTLCVDLDRDEPEDEEEADVVVFHGEPDPEQSITGGHLVR